MLCRLYDTKNKRYINADETLDYMVHPVGAAFHLGAEDHRLNVELSTQHDDKNGHTLFVNDLVRWQSVTYRIAFFPAWGCFGLTPVDSNSSAPLGHGGSSTAYAPYTWHSYRNQLEWAGTIHDEEMEAL